MLDSKLYVFLSSGFLVLVLEPSPERRKVPLAMWVVGCIVRPLTGTGRIFHHIPTEGTEPQRSILLNYKEQDIVLKEFTLAHSKTCV